MSGYVCRSTQPTSVRACVRAQHKRGHGGPAFTPRRSNERHDDSSPDHDTRLYKYIVKGGVHCQQRCLLLRFLLRSVTKELAPEWSAVSEKGRVGQRAHRIRSPVTRCTQKGHGFLRAEACDACENADEGNRADDPHTLRAAHQPTSLVGTTPLAAAKSLDGLRGRGQELEAAHLRGRAQQMTASHRADERSPAAQEATELLRYGDNGLRESRLRLDGGAALLLQSILPLCMAHLLVLFGGRTCCLHCGKHQAD